MTIWLLANFPIKERSSNCGLKASRPAAELLKVESKKVLDFFPLTRGHTQTHTHRYVLAIFLLIHGQTKTQTTPAQTSDSARVMRKMAHIGSISNPSTTDGEQHHGLVKIRV